MISEGRSARGTASRASGRGWSAIIAMGIVCILVGGAGAGMIGTVLGPIMSDLKWSNGAVGSLATAYTLGYLAAQPIAGIAVDRAGPRATMLAGTLVASSAVWWAARSDQLQALRVAFMLAGAGFGSSFYAPSGVLVARWLPGRKALGMGIAVGSLAGGAMLFSTSIAWCVEQAGWRSTLDYISALEAGMLLVIFFTIANGPPAASASYSSDRSAPNAHLEHAPAEATSSAQDFRSTTFFLTTLSGLLFNFGIQALYYFVVPILTGVGYSPRIAGLALGATWMVSAAGSMLLGMCADRIGSLLTLSVTLAVGGLATVLLEVSTPGVFGVAFASAFVLFWGLASNSFPQIAPVLLAERLSSERLGALLGWQFAASGIMGAAAPTVTGALFDSFGSYSPAIWLSAAATFLSALPILLLRSPRIS